MPPEWLILGNVASYFFPLVCGIAMVFWAGLDGPSNTQLKGLSKARLVPIQSVSSLVLAQKDAGQVYTPLVLCFG